MVRFYFARTAPPRSLQTDILFGLVRQLQRRRPDDLRVVVMSATLDVGPFCRFFADAVATRTAEKRTLLRRLCPAPPLPQFRLE